MKYLNHYISEIFTTGKYVGWESLVETEELFLPGYKASDRD